jgi:hypothetical protein
MNKEDRDTILKASRALLLIGEYGVIDDSNFEKTSNGDALAKKRKYIDTAYDLYCADMALASAAALVSIFEFYTPGAGALGMVDIAFSISLQASVLAQLVQITLIQNSVEALEDLGEQSVQLKDED